MSPPDQASQSALKISLALMNGQRTWFVRDPTEADAVAGQLVKHPPPRSKHLTVQFAQERKLRTLNRAPRPPGKTLVSSDPADFRWQIDEPPSLIGIKTADQPPPVDRHEGAHHPHSPPPKPDGSAADPAMEIMQSLLSADTAKFAAQFRILSAKPAESRSSVGH
jgi:hypothetical protein